MVPSWNQQRKFERTKTEMATAHAMEPEKVSVGMRFGVRCTVCGQVFLRTSPVFAGSAATKHANDQHPNTDGLVGIIFEIPRVKLEA